LESRINLASFDAANGNVDLCLSRGAP